MHSSEFVFTLDATKKGVTVNGFPRQFQNVVVRFHLQTDRRLKRASKSEAHMTIYKRAGTKNLLLDVTGSSGRRIRKSSGTTEMAEARRQEAQLLIELGGPIFDIGRASTFTISQLTEKFLAYQAGLKRRSLKGFFELQCRSFEKWAGEKTPLSKINLELLQSYQAVRVAEASASSANRAFQVLHRMFHLAVSWKLIDENPATGLERLKEPGGRERFLNMEEQARLLESCQEPFTFVVFTALRSGMRRGELLGIKSRDVDLVRGLITLRNTKTDSPRRVPMLPEVRELLARLIRLEPDPDAKLFKSSHNTPYTPDGVKANFKRACRRARLPDVRFHDLRHTFASDSLASRMPMMVLRDILGHTSVKTTERYAHLADAQVIQAMKDLDKYLGAAQSRHSSRRQAS